MFLKFNTKNFKDKPKICYNKQVYTFIKTTLVKIFEILLQQKFEIQKDQLFASYFHLKQDYSNSLKPVIN